MTADPKVAAAATEARLARARLTNTLAELQTRLRLAHIAQRLIERAKDKGEDIVETGLVTAQKRPLAAAGAGTALFGLLFRKPLGRLLRRATARAKARSSDEVHAKGSTHD